jgi:S1-C subfamily serine protease
LIVAVDGHPVEQSNDLQQALNRKRPGDRMELTLFRNGRNVRVVLVLAASGGVL